MARAMNPLPLVEPSSTYCTPINAVGSCSAVRRIHRTMSSVAGTGSTESGSLPRCDRSARRLPTCRRGSALTARTWGQVWAAWSRQASNASCTRYSWPRWAA
ncbi:MAG: hypothetical protein KatS3mg103_0263 [Phycisphaerales bacterium]|nr:MAG: hypothetical protein KatS3mg103_0263 [Phycisphaerales bacterium]